MAALVGANILPVECGGQWGRGLVAERKRRVEREWIKAGLRVWLERKAGEIRGREGMQTAGVKVLVWRFSKRLFSGGGGGEVKEGDGKVVWGGEEGTVRGLRMYWEGIGKGDTRHD